MLTRELEPEVMDSQEESMAYDDMDHQQVNEQFVTDLLATGGVQGEVLDLGTGPARIPILLCRQQSDVRVVGVDLSVSMLDIAKMNIEMASLADRIMLDRADAKSLPLDDGRFDVVMSNSIVHHIPCPEQALAECVRVCRPGGLLFLRDLIRPDSADALDQLCQTYVADESEHARKMFADSLRASLTIDEVKAIVADLGLSPGGVSATSDRHWTWSDYKPS